MVAVPPTGTSMPANVIGLVPEVTAVLSASTTVTLPGTNAKPEGGTSTTSAATTGSWPMLVTVRV